MEVLAEVLHILLDVASGARNLARHEAEKLHKQVTPGYGEAPVSDAEAAAAQAILDRQAAQRKAASEDTPKSSLADGE